MAINPVDGSSRGGASPPPLIDSAHEKPDDDATLPKIASPPPSSKSPTADNLTRRGRAFAPFAPHLPMTAEASLFRGVICTNCLGESLIPASDKDHLFCPHCGDSLRMELKFAASPFRKHTDVAIAFLKISIPHETGAEEMGALLEKFREDVSDAVEVQGGFVKFVSDKALIVMGMESTSSKEKTSADVNAGKLMTALLQVIEKTRPEAVLYSLGAHLGSVSAGMLGHTGEKGFDVLGSDVNFTARLMSASAEQGGLVISQPMRQALADGGFEGVVPLGAQKIKGFRGEFPLYRVTGNLTDTPATSASNKIEGGIKPGICTEHATVKTPFCPYCGNPVRISEAVSFPIAQRREVYVLSIDMMGFSQRASSMTADEIARWISDFYAVAEPLVTRHHGKIVSRIGDEIIVRFGVPSVGENAINAVLAATELRQALNAWNQQAGASRIHFRIGIAFGSAYVRGTHTVGPVIDRAMEIQSSAPADGVQIGAEISDSVAPYFALAETPWGYVAGQPDYEAIDLAHRRQEIPIIGRARQVVEIEKAFEKVLAGEMQTTLLLGPAGSGRQSVAAHFESQHVRDINILRGSSTPWRRDPLRWALRDFFGQMPGGTPADKLDRLVATSRFDTSLFGAFPFGFDNPFQLMRSLIGRYIGMEVDKNAGIRYLRKNPAQLEALTVKATASLLAGMARQKPLVLEFQKMEHADLEELGFLAQVFNLLGKSPVLVLASSEESLIHDARRREIVRGFPGTQNVWFRKLGPSDATELILGLLPSPEPQKARLDENLAQNLYAQANGHPLYLMELSRAYLEKGWIVWDEARSTWFLKEPQDERLPQTFDEVLRARLDSLSYPEQKVFMAASLMAARSGVFRAEGLLYLIQEARVPLGLRRESELYQVLARLEHKGLVSQNRITPPRLGLLTASAAVDVDKKNIHAGIYGWLSTEISIRSYVGHEEWALLAFHAAEAGKMEVGYQFYLQASQGAYAQGHNQESLAYLAEAEALLAKWSPPRLQLLHFDLLAKKVRIHTRQSHREAWDDSLKKMEEIAKRTTLDEARILEAIVERGNFKVVMGENDPGWFEAVAPKIRVWSRQLDPARLALFYFCMGKSFSYASQYEKALHAYNEAERQADLSDDPLVAAKVLLGKSTLCLRLLKFGEAHESARQAAEFFKIGDDWDNYCYALINMGDCLVNLGKYEEAVQVLKKAVGRAKQIQNPMAVGFALLNEGMAYGYLGSWTEGVDRIDEAIALAGEVPSLLVGAFFERSILVSRTNPEEGIKYASASLELQSGPSGTPPSFRATALFSLGLAHARNGDWEASLDPLHEALRMRGEELEGGRLEICDRELCEVAALAFSKMASGGRIKKEQRALFEKIFEEVRLMARPPSPLVVDLFFKPPPPALPSGKGSAAVSRSPVRLVSGGHSSASSMRSSLKLVGEVFEDSDEPTAGRRQNSKMRGGGRVIPPLQVIRMAPLLNRTLILR